MKKRILFIALALTLVISLCACGSPSPTETTDSFLKALKAEDADTLKSVYGGNGVDITGELEEIETDGEGPDKALEKEIKAKALDFDYEIAKENIDGDKATVDVKITTYDFGRAFDDCMTEYFNQAFSMALDDVSEEELTSLATKLWTEELKSVKKNYKQTVTVSLSQKDGKWVIDEFDEDGDFYNALAGGLIGEVAEMEDAFDFEE